MWQNSTIWIAFGSVPNASQKFALLDITTRLYVNLVHHYSILQVYRHTCDELISGDHTDTTGDVQENARTQDIDNVTVRPKPSNRSKAFHSQSPTPITNTAVYEGLKEMLCREIRKAFTADFASLRVSLHDKIEEMCLRLKNLEEKVDRSNYTIERKNSLGYINSCLEYNFGKLDERLTDIEKKIT